MSFKHPVYKEIAKFLKSNPEHANVMPLDQLATMVELSKTHAGLVDAQIIEIYNNRTRPKPLRSEPLLKIKVKTLKQGKAAVSDIDDAIGALKADYNCAQSMTQDLLEKLLKTADESYFNGSPVIDDKIYDYVKHLYNQRRLKTNDKKLTMVSISSDTGVGFKPKRERDVQLPFAMRSLDNICLGENDVEEWVKTHDKTTYNISAKLDGVSALYYRGQLFTRGDALIGRDISHILKFIKLPIIPDDIGVRGEIVMSKDLFDLKYKGKNSPGHPNVRKVNRSSVAGAVSSINNIDAAFLSDMHFVAYEIISESDLQMTPQEQFGMLRDMKFLTAWTITFKSICDESLSKLYHSLLSDYLYEIDGLVVHENKPYVRVTDNNPTYAKAYKEALESTTMITEITAIEWEYSQYSYMIPVAIFAPVTIQGVTLSRATAHNAKHVVDNGLGPGAKVEVIHWGKTNPRINLVLEPAKPGLPTFPYEWINDVNIRAIDMDASALRKVQIKKIYKSLLTIGATNVGEKTVEKIYDHGLRNVGQVMNVTEADLAFLGPNNGRIISESINKALGTVTIPILMASSKVFGRGLGTRKFAKVLKMYPNFLAQRLSDTEYLKIFNSVDGFAEKTSDLAVEGMSAFWDFVESEIPTEIYKKILQNTIDTLDEAPGNGHPDIENKHICLTGFRSQKIMDFIKHNRGIVQTNCTSKTDILVRSTANYTNLKTTYAETNGIKIMDQAEFMNEYMLN